MLCGLLTKVMGLCFVTKPHHWTARMVLSPMQRFVFFLLQESYSLHL